MTDFTFLDLMFYSVSTVSTQTDTTSRSLLFYDMILFTMTIMPPIDNLVMQKTMGKWPLTVFILQK